MALQLFSAAPSSNNNLATYKAWAKGISDAIFATGLLVKTADTGQVVWASVVALPDINTTPHYEIYGFDDDLQATSPFYIKLEYGAATTTYLPRISISVGTSTNGAGTLTGNVTALMTLIYASQNTTVRDCAVSADSNRLQIAMFIGAANLAFAMSVARTKDEYGNDTGDGVSVMAIGPSRHQQYLPAVGGGTVNPAASSITMPYVCAAPGAGTGGYGTNLGVFPIYPCRGYSDNPCMGALVYFTADITVGSTVQVELYGTLHTFIALGTHATVTNGVNGNTTSNSWLVRYE